MLKIKDSPTRSEFLSAYDEKIDEYNQTNTEVLPNTIRLQCLRMCIMQDKTLYNAYTGFLTSKRSSHGPTWQPAYDEFYRILQNNAAMLDSGSKTSYKANSSIFDNDDDDDDDDDYDDMVAYFTQRHPSDINAYFAQRGPRRRQRPTSKHHHRNVRFPDDLRRELPTEFLRAFNSLKVTIQHRICSLFSTNKAEKNSELVVRQRHFDFDATNSDDDTLYLSSNSIEHSDSSFEDQSWHLPDYSDGEIDGADESDDDNNSESSTTELAVNRLKSSLKRAPGIRSHKLNQLGGRKKKKETLPTFRSLRPGAPTKVLANDLCYITKKDGTRLATLNFASLKRYANANANAKAQSNSVNFSVTMAQSYAHFSATGDDDNDKSDTTTFDGNCFYECTEAPNITYHTTINLRAIYNTIMSLIDGGANGTIGGKDMTLMWYRMDHKRVNVGVANLSLIHI